MKRKYLYALALLLALSTVAFSNERARFRCGSAGRTPSVSGPSHEATAGETPGASENHVFLHTFIKLLYI
jgi:hypothetical protein